MRKTLRSAPWWSPLRCTSDGASRARQPRTRGSHPTQNDIVGVGSDTTEFLVQALAGGFNKASRRFDADGVLRRRPGRRRSCSARARTRSPGRTVRPPASTSCRPTRTSRSRAPRVARTLPATRARASTRTPRTSSATSTRSPKSNVDPNLTAADLYNIYTCQKTDWSDFGMPAGPHPGQGSAGRFRHADFFLASIGETETQLQDAIAQPDNVCSVTEVEEHDPSAVDRPAERGRPVLRSPATRSSTKGPRRRSPTPTSAPFNVTRESTT